MAGVRHERFAAARGDRHRDKRYAIAGRMLHYGMDECQPLRRWVLNRPAAKTERRATGGDPPKLRTTHTAGTTERFYSSRLAFGRVEIEYLIYFE